MVCFTKNIFGKTFSFMLTKKILCKYLGSILKRSFTGIKENTLDTYNWIFDIGQAWHQLK